MNRNEMKPVIELAFRKYSKEKDNIKRGWIKQEHIQMVTDSLFLEELSNEELSDMWLACDRFFDELYCVFNKQGEVVGYKPYNQETEFARDTKSAWLEVINAEARKRKSSR